ncbi:MAG: hypothetical protein CVU90_02090 [Firmicutes bacterium HGW-Firmicutes-15]|nr:MAG: hypothetical protein CVU90_02090 [Firmicutes bacterium HGW-Firmicutes-15]
MDIYISLLIGILSGVVSGLISGYAVTIYFRNIDRIRLIVQYAQYTLQHAEDISDEAYACSKGKELENLNYLLRKSSHSHRNFDGGIPDQELQKAIASCNEGIYHISNAAEEPNSQSQLFFAHTEMPNRILDLHNALVNFEVAEERKTEKHIRVFRNIALVVVVLTVLGLIIA